MKSIIFLIGVIVAILLAPKSYAENNQEISLKGKWKFTIGDDAMFAAPTYDDSNWDEIYVPKRWEEQGFNGYNGFAWYRTSVLVPTAFDQRMIHLELGFIDDVDEVFFNGVKIGQSGSFPPQFTTAYNAFRKYVIPLKLIRFDGRNTIAVRTYDSQLEGGIVRGNVRLVAGGINILPDIDMSGMWNFETHSYHTQGGEILVPGSWENQGYYNYDGLATYSRLVTVTKNMANKKLIFMAGKIDDDDELYINGTFIARTGDINSHHNTNMHTQIRNYFIPEGVIKPGKNLIEIKVLDRGGPGGILEGSVGLITQDNFIKYWRLKRFDNY